MVIPSFRTFSLSCLVALVAVANLLPAMAEDATTGTTTNAGSGLRPAATDVSVPVVSVDSAPGTLSPARLDKIRKSRRVATQMAKYEWLDKVAAANPSVLAAICAHPGPAKLIARHRHLNKLADADHYLCRRLTRFSGSTDALIHATYCDHVITLDPEGIYIAIARDPSVGTVLASHVMFDEMVMANPDLGRVIAQHMR